MFRHESNIFTRGFLGFAFGSVFYLALANINYYLSEQLRIFASQQFQYDKPYAISALLAITLAISWGLRTLFYFLSQEESLIITSILFGVVGLISFIGTGIKRGMIIFMLFFVLLFIALAFLVFIFIYT